LERRQESQERRSEKAEPGNSIRKNGDGAEEKKKAPQDQGPYGSSSCLVKYYSFDILEVKSLVLLLEDGVFHP
jgi:hypothetical protein